MDRALKVVLIDASLLGHGLCLTGLLIQVRQALQLREVFQHQVDLACTTFIRYVLQSSLILVRNYTLVFDEVLESDMVSSV